MAKHSYQTPETLVVTINAPSIMLTGSDEQESVDTQTVIDDDVITPLSRRDSYLWED